MARNSEHSGMWQCLSCFLSPSIFFQSKRLIKLPPLCLHENNWAHLGAAVVLNRCNIVFKWKYTVVGCWYIFVLAGFREHFIVWSISVPFIPALLVLYTDADIPMAVLFSCSAHVVSEFVQGQLFILVIYSASFGFQVLRHVQISGALPDLCRGIVLDFLEMLEKIATRITCKRTNWLSFTFSIKFYLARYRDSIGSWLVSPQRSEQKTVEGQKRSDRI